MKADPQKIDVAIVGGGFSGTMLSAQLTKRGMSSLVLDGSGRAGRGTAYSTTDGAHLLNVRAEAMSAWPDRPSDFAEYFVENGGNPREFAERRQFGRYLRAILDQALATGLAELRKSSAVRASPDGSGWQLSLDDGSTVAASSLVLANGNEPPAPFTAEAVGLRGFVNDPWGEEARQAVTAAAASGGDVLLLGTGLTMVDSILSLSAAGHSGNILAISRRGLIPRSHADFTPAPADLSEVPQGDLLRLWRWLRRRGGQVGWRAAVDALRPHSHALWRSLDPVQQRRFLRHARPWWDVHRHRIAPQVSREIVDAVASGRLEIAAGRTLAFRQDDDGCILVELRRRGRTAKEERRFSHVFNCTGPLGTLRHTRDPLLKSLLETGLVRNDGLGMGIAIDDRSRALDAKRLWALGPMTRGQFWEIVAVPDIRSQAAAVAQDIAEELRA